MGLTPLAASQPSQGLPRPASGLTSKSSSLQRTLTLAILGGLIYTRGASSVAGLMVVARPRSPPRLQHQRQHCPQGSVRETTVDVLVNHHARPAIRHQVLANGRVVVVALVARARTTMVGCVNPSMSRVHAMPKQIVNGSPIDGRQHVWGKGVPSWWDASKRIMTHKP